MGLVVLLHSRRLVSEDCHAGQHHCICQKGHHRCLRAWQCACTGRRWTCRLLTNPGRLPEQPSEPRPIIEQAGELGLDVSACTDRQQHHGQERLEIEQGGHGRQRPCVLVMPYAISLRE